MIGTTPGTRPMAIVADDDLAIRILAVEVLEEAGYGPLEAEHGDHAIQVLEKHHARVRLLFTDVQLLGGERDGFA